MLRLAKKYSEERLEKACTKGLKIGATRYQQIESMLANKLEDLPLSKPQLPILPDHENVRGSNYYQ